MIQSWALNDLSLTNSILDAYLTGDDTIAPCFSEQPNLDGIQKAIEIKRNSFSKTQRSTLIQVLHEQLDAIEDESLNLEKTRKQIDSLLEENVFTTTTGQQLHLFLGPGYFINKIFNCIKVAQHFNKRKGKDKLVPVFWMASEDHDIDEISGVELFGQTYSAQLTKGKITGAQDTQLILPLIKELEERLGTEAKHSVFFQICKKAYESLPTLSQATAFIIYRLFAHYGIVVLDANHPELKKQFKAVAEEEITHQSSLQLQTKTKHTFDALGFHYQVMPRGTNLFIIDEQNNRIIAEATKYDENINYSPNALLRPLYQEIILPNAAYIGGMAEINYWLQLKSIFENYHIPFPVIWARDTLQIAKTKKIEQLLSKKQSISQIANWDEELFNKEFIEKELTSELTEQLDKTNEIIKGISTDIGSEEWNTLYKENLALSIEVKKHFRALKKTIFTGKRYKTESEMAKKLYDSYFNKQKLQERTVSCLSLALNFKQIETLDGKYLGSVLRHAHYYLLGN